MELPGAESVADVDLEVFERRLELVSENPVYKLEVRIYVRGECVRVCEGWVCVPGGLVCIQVGSVWVDVQVGKTCTLGV